MECSIVSTTVPSLKPPSSSSTTVDEFLLHGLEDFPESIFLAAMRAALDAGKPLVLQGKRVVLRETIKLKRGDALVLEGGSLIGHAHSVFSLGTDRNPTTSPPALTLRGVTVRHLKSSEDKREVGAALFVMGKARVLVEDCTLSSVEGFGIWVKHQGSALVRRSAFSASGRTGVALFNSATVELDHCTIAQAKVHGVCLRGSAKATLSECRIEGCGDRGAFVYEGGTLEMIGCCVTGTKHGSLPAVHAQGFGRTVAASVRNKPPPAAEAAAAVAEATAVEAAGTTITNLVTAMAEASSLPPPTPAAAAMFSSLRVSKCRVVGNASPVSISVEGPYISWHVEEEDGNEFDRRVLLPTTAQEEGGKPLLLPPSPPLVLSTTLSTAAGKAAVSVSRREVEIINSDQSSRNIKQPAVDDADEGAVGGDGNRKDPAPVAMSHTGYDDDDEGDDGDDQKEEGTAGGGGARDARDGGAVTWLTIPSAFDAKDEYDDLCCGSVRRSIDPVVPWITKHSTTTTNKGMVLGSDDDKDEGCCRW
eukprot:CAMPEP_0171928438 /NCGR_PEP_ID=MMETSP0993-20121228/26812_1 /TAXON_ID=483369 /ORGANISM="non described non described, Strain CCMP2098" /LENGTH=532 /DNA_ID=CAMNT_0012567767 /DNA_START=160 /DNA_END=1758 /DNA_ORIENTATION=-